MIILIGLTAMTLIMSIASFLLMRYDKQCARQGKRRVPERTLFFVAGLFGAIGGTIGMHLFHHKTKHWYFRAFFPAMMLVQIAIIAFVVLKTMG